VRVTVGPADSGVKMILVLKSDDPAALAVAAQAATRDLRTLPGVGNITSSASLVRPEVVLRPDFARAADLGVTADAIGETVRVATAGDYDVGLAKLNLERRQVPIRRAPAQCGARRPGRHRRLTVPGKPMARCSSPTWPASIHGRGPAQVNRLDRSRNVILEVELGSSVSWVR
jgi:multidrug efflux pump subunit AcrB